LRSSVSYLEVGRPVPETQQVVNSFIEEEELTEFDDQDIHRRPQTARKHPLEFILHEGVPRVRSWLRFVSESTNFTIRCL